MYQYTTVYEAEKYASGCISGLKTQMETSRYAACVESGIV